MTYISGFVAPVPNKNKQQYIEASRKSWELFREYGALHHVEAWGEDVPKGKQTDFHRAVDLKDGETVVFAWIIWPDKATLDKCESAMKTDKRFEQMEMPFDGKRMIYGGFETIFEEKA